MSNERLLTLFMFLGYILKIILILIPIIIIVLGTIDLVKYVINPNDNKNNIKLFTKRLILGVSIFFVTIIVSFVFNTINQNINNQYFKCFSNPSLCNQIVDNMRNDVNNCKKIDNKDDCCKFILNNKKASYNKDIDDCTIPISTLIK